MRLFALILLCFFSNQIQAKTCTYSLVEGSGKLTWTGYKFTEKLGVNGSFDTIKFTQQKNSSSLKQLLESVSWTVSTASINTKNPARDKTIRDNFFANMNDGGSIHGMVESYDGPKKTARAKLTMNRKSQSVSFKVARSGNKLAFTSAIDILKFGMNKSYDAIQKACKALHTGKDGKSKTWSEVGLLAEVEVTEVCR